ncbi:hypothetical protein BH20ACT3_BH20ACT3_07170 [soil metagenome]
MIIDFETPTTEHWAGCLRAGSSEVDPVHFDGRLQLLRLLEALIERTDNEPPYDIDRSTS